ncbi:MAG: hypothetical protein LBV06_01995 [Propionibacteriaceae bacterium]|jgi:translation initiation factor IF-1|nr:hypothetical protein [Propionibacteriaceae bacterium]
MTTYLLKPRIPGGTWLSILLLVIGTVVTAVSFAAVMSIGLRVVGSILALGGLALLIMTVVRMRQQRVWVTFDDEGYTIEGPRGEYSGSWVDVTDVAVSRKTAKIALWHGEDRRTVIAHPAGRMDDEFMRVREGIRAHLEALDA